MALSVRPSMRQLSSRLRYLRDSPRLRPTPYISPISPISTISTISIRCSSRYSNPGPRAAVSIPSEAATFTASEPASGLRHAFPEHDDAKSAADQAAARRQYEEERAYHLRRMRFAGVGLLLSVGGLAITLYNLDLDEIEKAGRKNKLQLDAPPDSKDKFQGRDIHVIGAGQDKRIVAEGEQEVDLVQTGSGSVPYFPRRIYLPRSTTNPTSPVDAPVVPVQGHAPNEEEYTLVGLGIRTVTIFSIEVYVMGLYVRTQDISAVQSRLIHLINPQASTLVPAEKDQLKQQLLDPNSSIAVWDQLLRETGALTAWRVVPSKNTDFAHLRDGWMNGIKRAVQEIRRAGPALEAAAPAAQPNAGEYDDETFGDAIRVFKDLFTRGGRTPKGSTIFLARDASGALDVLFENPTQGRAMENIGSVRDPRISRLLWMGYLAGQGVSSEAARRDVVDGFVGFAGRPLGSVETMVR